MTWRKVLVVWVCAWVAVPGWTQEAARSLELVAEGIAAYEGRDWRGCTEALERAVAQGFSDPLMRLDALVFLGRAYAALGQEERARAYFRQALEVQPDYRLEATDPNGLGVFASLVAMSEQERAPVDGRGGVPIRAVVLAALVAAGAAALVILGGGGTEAAPEGTIEGSVTLP